MLFLDDQLGSRDSVGETGWAEYDNSFLLVKQDKDGASAQGHHWNVLIYKYKYKFTNIQMLF